MVWSVFDTAVDTGLAAARDWAALHGHLAAPVDAVVDGGYAIGEWLKNMRDAAKAVTLTEERREQLEDLSTGTQGAVRSLAGRCGQRATVAGT
jgi:hypothetical protein